MPTSGKEWRKRREEGIEVVLPSGMRVRLRPMGAAMLLRSGIVPDYLTDALVKRTVGMEADEPEPPDQEAVRAKLVYLDEIARRMFVSPRIVDKPIDQLADDEITIDDVDDVDKLVLPGLVGAPPAFMSDFLHGQTAHLADVLLEQGFSNGSQPVPETEAGTGA